MKIENLEPGMTVYSVSRGKLGNTTMKTVRVYDIKVVEVDTERQRVRAHWNVEWNPARWYYGRSWSKWRKAPPMLIEGVFGSHRLATRAEIKAAKALPPKEPSGGES